MASDPHPTREQKDAARQEVRMAEMRSGQLALFMRPSEIMEMASAQHGDMIPMGLDVSNPEHHKLAWERKLEESKDPDFRRYHPRTGEDTRPWQTGSLYEHLSETGGPVTPVHLARGAIPNRFGVPLEEEIPRSVVTAPGQTGAVPNTWTVAGGGHRIAAMNEINPDLPIHVEHHESPTHAEGISTIQQLVEQGADLYSPEHQHIMSQYFRTDEDFVEAWHNYRRGRRYD